LDSTLSVVGIGCVERRLECLDDEALEVRGLGPHYQAVAGSDRGPAPPRVQRADQGLNKLVKRVKLP
jgi:hypothetical protein